MTILKNKYFLSVISISVILFLSFLFINFYKHNNKTALSNNFLLEDNAREIADFSDLRNLVGFAKNITVVKIISREEKESLDGIFPLTMYQAEVLYNIKGDLKGTVDFAQNSGFLPPNSGFRKNNDQDIVLLGGEFLDEGEIYILMSTLYPDLSKAEGKKIEGIYHHKNAIKTLDEKTLELLRDETKERNEILESDFAVQELKDAYKNEK